MSANSRIDNVSMTPTVSRQTPRDSFGDKISQGAVKVGGAASALLTAVGAGPIVSAAVSVVNATGGRVASTAYAASGIVNAGGPGTIGAPQTPQQPGAQQWSGNSGVQNISGATPVATQSSGTPDDAGSATSELSPKDAAFLAEMKESSAEYLRLQKLMEQESREYNTISNVMKLRHDSAKSAINNIH